MQRDYLAAWLALVRPLAVTCAATAAGAGSIQGTAGDTWEAVTAEAIRVGAAVVDKYKGCAAGVSAGLCQTWCTFCVPQAASLVHRTMQDSADVSIRPEHCMAVLAW